VLYNNTLGINVRSSHFNESSNRNCSFCQNEQRTYLKDEIFFHIFFGCPTTLAWHTAFASKYLGDSVVGRGYFGCLNEHGTHGSVSIWSSTQYRGLYFSPKTIFIPPPPLKIIFFPPLTTRRFSTPIGAFLP
jgi:hypothetical protein